VIDRAGVLGALAAGGRNGGAPARYHFRRLGAGGLEWFDLPDADSAAWLSRAARLAGAAPPPAGLSVVVGDAGITGALVHAALEQGVGLDLRRRTAGLVGRPVGSRLVTVIDDPSRPGGNGFYRFDDEGMAAGPTTIVNQGVLERGLSDLLGGRREAWDRPAGPRPSNSFITPGPTPPAELIAGVAQGIFVAGPVAASGNARDWSLRLVAAYGEIIEKGRLTGRVVGPVTLGGNVPELLGSVDGVGNDFRLEAAGGWNDGPESLPSGAGGPTLRFRARVS
jgi:TldD protein